MQNKITTQVISTFRIILISSLTIFTLYTVQAWISPTVSAPNGNVGGPLTTATTTQVKTGSLGLTGDFLTGGNISAIGTISATGTIKALGGLIVTGTTTTNGLKVVNGAGANKVLTSDASGNANWATAGSDHGMQIFTTSGTFAVPAGVTQVLVSGIGGGGGGAGANVFNSNPCQANGLGGTAGTSVILMPINVAPLTNIPVTIGAGGLGGVGAGPCPFGYGGTGGQTLFGPYSIPGGPGGGKGGPGDGAPGWQGLSGGLGSKAYPSAPTAVPAGHYGAGGGGGGFIATPYAYSGTAGYPGLLIVSW